MREGGEFAIVCAIGNKLQLAEANGRHGWRDAKALVVLVARSGEWNAAADLASALGIPEDRATSGDRSQEAIYREVYGEEPPHRIAPPPAAAVAAGSNVHHLPRGNTA